MLGALWGFSLWALGRLPGRVPIHWNFSGKVDGWGSPLMACLPLPAIATLVYLLIIPLPGAVIYAYWIRHRMDHPGTHPSEVP